MRIDRLQPADRLGDIYCVYALLLQTDHFAEPARGDQVHGGYSEARGQDAIEGCRRSPSLDMSQHAHPHFFVSTQRDGIADQIAD